MSSQADKLEQIRRGLISMALDQQWNFKYAKFGREHKQSLFVHALNTFSVTKVLAENLFDLDTDSVIIACLAGFLHDYQKADEKWQSAALSFMSGKRVQGSAFSHDDGSDDQRSRLVDLLQQAEAAMDPGHTVKISQFADRILNIIVYTHDTQNRADAARRKKQVGPIDALVPVVRLSDAIASIKTPAEILRRAHDLDLPTDKTVSFEYHELSMIRGLTTTFLNQALLELMKECGYIPLLYFGSGTVYLVVGEPTIPDNVMERLEELLDDQVTTFQGTTFYKTHITNAVIGPLTQTTWPCVHLADVNSIPQILAHISNMPTTNKDKKYGKSLYDSAKAKHKPAVETFLKQIGADRDETLAEMGSDFSFLIYVASFLKEYQDIAKAAGVIDEYTADVNDWLKALLGEFDLELCSKKIKNTADLTTRVEIITKLWQVGTKDLHRLPREKKRKILIKNYETLMVRVLKKYKRYAPPIFSETSKKLLFADVAHVPFVLLSDTEIRSQADGPSKRYQAGKEKSRRICSLCGAVAEDTAPAPLFGDGSEKFSNFLPAGVSIGSGKKAQVCDLCIAEGTLRALFFPSPPATTFIVLPDLSLSPELAKQWADGVQSFAMREKIGLSSSRVWNMTDIYKLLARGEIVNNATDLSDLLHPTKQRVDDLAKHLRNDAGKPENVGYRDLVGIGKLETFEEIARAHLHGDIEIEPDHLMDFQMPQPLQSSTYLTPNHLFMFLRNPPYEDKEESKSTTAIRTYFMAMLLAVVYHARVITMEGFQPISDFTLKGLVRTQLPAPASIALASYGITEEMPLSNVKDALQKLAAVTLITLYQVKKLGKDRLLRILSMNRGAILRRAQTELGEKLKGGTRRRLVNWLDVLPDIVDDHPIIIE
ncbi:MAG: type I-D CRISPR-associated protein Cas10d/Csc3 [Candidatus Thorarchaeota archaeon]|nr:type I-D CRISPR-associated protein Cas10d/Csc3 [Candidatus Thorarchaeota archaeon]